MADQPMGRPMFRGHPPRFVGYKDGTRMPTFSKKHYEVIAAAINAAHRQSDFVSGPSEDYKVGVSATARRIADAFKEDNSRFDIFKFVEACTRETDTKR